MQNNEQYILLGGKWGWSSYEPGEDEEKRIPSVNYSDCWAIPYINLCHWSFDNEGMMEYLNMNRKTRGSRARLPVIWFWESGAFMDTERLSQADDFFEAYDQYQREMQARAISAMGDRRALIVGALSDPPADGWPENMTILSTSCQTRLNQLAGTAAPNLEYPALARDLKGLTPTPQFSQIVYQGRKAWGTWKRLGLFTDAHPTRRFIELFAQETKEDITTWLNSHNDVQ